MTRTLLPGLVPVSVCGACRVVVKTRSRYPYIGRLGENGLYVAVDGNGHGARGRDEIGRLASTVVLGQERDFPSRRRRSLLPWSPRHDRIAPAT
ncbi:hypothetical protein [Streptomyces sp. NPDC005828]|uniref:hypothetical protein n=1 Tax=Streptomyces sp. NPDC005828 TaxID=3157071 RepID=UPI00340BD74D